jgi:hypothetical protein
MFYKGLQTSNLANKIQRPLELLLLIKVHLPLKCERRRTNFLVADIFVFCHSYQN